MARSVPAVTRAMDVLELFLDGDTNLPAREITERLSLPRTTVHELVHTLVSRGYLAPVGDGSYSLGLRLFQLGSAYAERIDLARDGQRIAEDVAKQCDETVHVAVLDRADVIYIVKVDGGHSVRMVSAVGHRLPAHCTAVGKMLLSGLSTDGVRAVTSSDGQLPALTEKSITTVDSLLEALEKVRKQGLAFEQNESNPDVACVAAPVYDRSAEMVAAMSIAVPINRWRKRRRSEWAEMVSAGATELSRRLGYQLSI